MKKILMSVVVASTMLASCSNNEEITNASSSNELGVNVNVLSTKSLVNEFGLNTPIGLIMDGTGYTAALKSYQQIGAGAAWTPTVTDPVTAPFYLSNEVATIYGLYPFPADKADVSVLNKTLSKVKVVAALDFKSTEQTDYMYATADKTGAGTLESPYIYPLATANNSSDAMKQVKLFFHHALSKLTFTINKAGYTGIGKVVSLTLKSVAGNAAGLFQGSDVANGVMDLSATPANRIAGLSASETIALTSVNAGGDLMGVDANLGKVKIGAGDTPADYAIIQALVAPIDLPTTAIPEGTSASASNSIELTLNVDGTVFKPVYLPIGVAKWESGVKYGYTINVGATSLVVNKEVTVVAWDDYKGTIPELDVK